MERNRARRCCNEARRIGLLRGLQDVARAINIDSATQRQKGSQALCWTNYGGSMENSQGHVCNCRGPWLLKSRCDCQLISDVGLDEAYAVI